MRKQRITYFDIAKGIGIISIILGHLNVNTFNRIVFTYHVPLFFIISGYFISDKDDLSLFIRKRARGLLLPYLYTGLLCIIASLFYDYAYHQLSIKSVLDTIRAVIYGSGSGYNKTLLGIKPIGAIWFLLALFWSSIMVKVIKNSRFELPVVIAVFIVSVLSKEIVWLPFSLQSAGTALLFVYIGNVLKRKKIDFQKPNIWIIVSGMVFLMVEAYFRMTISFASNQFAYWYITIPGAVLISYVIISLSAFLEKGKNIVTGFLEFCGNNSIIILCYHLVGLNYIPWYLLLEKLKTLFPSLVIQYSILILLKICIDCLLTVITLRIKHLRYFFNR